MFQDHHFDVNDAFVVSAIIGAGAYLAYKNNLLPKNVVTYGAGGIIALSFVAAELDAIGGTLPIVIGGVGAIALAFFLL